MTNKKKNTPKFTLNMYWIYIPLLLFIVGLQFFSSVGAGSKNITKNKFTKILDNNDIEKIVIENNTVAQIFIKEEALNKDEYKTVTNSAFYRKGGPIYTYNFGDLQNFENEISARKQTKDLDFDKINEEPTSILGIIGDFLPFIILIGIWLFFMKRMSGGAGGAGGGGQIFNIGKSKAKLFDENTKEG